MNARKRQPYFYFPIGIFSIAEPKARQLIGWYPRFYIFTETTDTFWPACFWVDCKFIFWSSPCGTIRWQSQSLSFGYPHRIDQEVEEFWMLSHRGCYSIKYCWGVIWVHQFHWWYFWFEVWCGIDIIILNMIRGRWFCISWSEKSSYPCCRVFLFFNAWTS